MPPGPRVALIGAGRMGGPIAARLAAADHDPVVLARRPESRAAAEESGWCCAGTVEEAVRDADVVLTVVFDDEQLRTAVLGTHGTRGALAAMAPGSILVQHTTCDPATVIEIAAAAEARGVTLLDAAVSGNPRDIAAGQLTLWVGGEETALDAVRPVLDAYASPVMSVGPVGNGQRIKLINNMLFVAQVGLALDAIRVASELGISEEQVVDAVQHGSGGSRALGAVAWIGADAVGPRLAEFMLKDVAAARAAAQRGGAHLGLIGDVLGSDVVRHQVLRDGKPPDRASAAATRAAPGPVKGD
jgi:3-hydroxyisobutyrate dehydrogenase-like beta-hydroxyacid dehydrogenase